MPERILSMDEDLLEAFELSEYSPPEYVEASLNGIKAKCKLCTASWGFPTGPDGTVNLSQRNALLAHAHAHRTQAFRMRRLT